MNRHIAFITARDVVAIHDSFDQPTDLCFSEPSLDSDAVPVDGRCLSDAPGKTEGDGERRQAPEHAVHADSVRHQFGSLKVQLGSTFPFGAAVRE
jgi:hypothetical protein